MLVLTALIAAYLATGPSTRTRGIADVSARIARDYKRDPVATASSIPLLIACDVQFGDPTSYMTVYNWNGAVSWQCPTRISTEQHYYFWLFGYMAHLPYMREVRLEKLDTSSFYNADNWQPIDTIGP